MTPEPYVVELDPDTNTTLKMYLFARVQNMDVIKNNIIRGVWQCAAIKPSLVLDPFQVAVAANRAVLSEQQNTLVTKTVFSEILYNLSITRNITQSLTKFGIEKNLNLLVCFLVTDEWDASTEILPQIEGDLWPMSQLHELICLKHVRNAYKLNDLLVNEVSDATIMDIVVSKMVTKNFVTH